MRRRADYLSRRIAASVRSEWTGETPDTDAATIYRQRWERRDGRGHRVIDVLALDAGMATEFGAVRLRAKYKQDAEEWHLLDYHEVERSTSMLLAVLQGETSGERTLREQAFLDRVDKAL